MEWEGLYLGGPIDSRTGDRVDGLIDFDPDDLTTHGVIVGMTGSGKTGLGIIYIEEALRRGIPVLVIDPKGDMTNLLLTFPDLLPADFEPWVDEIDARRRGKTVAEMAEATATSWRSGLAGWGLGGQDIRALRDGAQFTIYTPGSNMGTPINLVGSLTRSTLDWETGVEGLRDEIGSFVSGLLGLVGIESDPISSREHILLANIIEHGWRHDLDLDLPTLVSWVQQPPLRKLGVFDVDSFFPPKDRRELALRLNGVIASPSFAAWNTGVEMDPDKLLWADDGRPQASILYLAHLSDEERQFVVALALSRLITWMRQQPGTSGLRALVYLDEAFGFAPPVGEPPAKRPILTILKQARAYGIGMLVATQNPMDLDYKAMSNAGTWNIGRLQTERDKARILEGLASATGDTPVDVFDTLISGLDKRQFVLHSTGRRQPEVFTTRWAMSYLRGPLTGPQLSRLTPPVSGSAVRSEGSEEVAETRRAPLAANETLVMPSAADGVAVRFTDPGAPWADLVGMKETSTRYQAAIVATVSLLYDDARAGVAHNENWEAVVTPLSDPFVAAASITVDHDSRDFSDVPPEGATFLLTDAPIGSKAYFRSVSSALRDHLDATGRVAVLRNSSVGIYSRVGEDREDFAKRCARAADDRADDAAANLREKYEAKLRRARDAFEASESRADELEIDVQGAKRTEWTDVAGTVIDFLSGRRSSRRAGTTARQRARVKSKQQRLRTAERKVADRRDDIEDLTEELEQELDELTEVWEAKALDIEEFDIGLERNDIRVDGIFLAWLPV